MILCERKLYYFYWGFMTLGQPAKRAERSGVSPTNPFGFSLDLLYSEMSSISINGLCFDPLLWYFVIDLLVKSCRKYIVTKDDWREIYDPLLWVLDL